MSNFRIPIESFEGGLAPGYFETDYPTFGNLNMAGKAEAINLNDPSYLAQGDGRTLLTSAQDEMRFLDEPVAENKTYAVGGETVYEVTPTSVSSIHTISGAEFEDVAYYQGDLYVSYNTSSDGVIAKYDISADTWTDSWQTGLNKDKPHRLLVGGLDFLYVANGNKVASYDGVNDIYTPDDLTLPEDDVIVSYQFTRNHLTILTNRPAITDGARSSVFLWDTNAPSWEVEYTFRERITNIFMLNGTPFVHYEDLGKARLGMLDGADIKPLASFGGSSPLWYQVTANKGFVAWVDGSDILVWGAPESYLESLMFPLMSAESGYEFNSVASPFGYLLVNSDDGTNYRTEIAENYAPNGYWKSLLVPISGNNKDGVIDSIRVDFEELPENRSFTVKLVDAKGNEKFSEEISEAGLVSYFKNVAITANSIRVEIHFDSITSSTVRIMSILLRGHTTK